MDRTPSTWKNNQHFYIKILLQVKHGEAELVCQLRLLAKQQEVSQLMATHNQSQEEWRTVAVARCDTELSMSFGLLSDPIGLEMQSWRRCSRTSLRRMDARTILSIFCCRSIKMFVKEPLWLRSAIAIATAKGNANEGNIRLGMAQSDSSSWTVDRAVSQGLYEELAKKVEQEIANLTDKYLAASGSKWQTQSLQMTQPE